MEETSLLAPTSYKLLGSTSTVRQLCLKVLRIIHTSVIPISIIGVALPSSAIFLPLIFVFRLDDSHVVSDL